MNKISLITGGARSGKSSFAEEKAKNYGEKILYLATAIPFDLEMDDRIKRHKSSRPSNWQTWEGYRNLDKIITEKSDQFDGILIDCITIMVTNIMLSHTDVDFDNMDTFDLKKIEEIETDIKKEIDQLIAAAKTSRCPIIIVTNEVGLGIVPENPVARAFRDFAGRANQMLGRAADEVFLAVCGVTMKIK